ncbi:MAG: hypothetical protein NTZ05_16155 [Chloroflexi bacterium]|nr:hypothetical protein [Chloroflexota bacterium]
MSGSPGYWTIDSSRVGTTFTIHSSSMGAGDCGMGSSWKGVAEDSDATNCTGLTCLWTTSNGTQAGPVRTRVSGYTGCNDTDGSFTGCLMVTPIAVPRASVGTYCTGTAGSSDLCVVAYALVSIVQTGSNTHTATLLNGSAYMVLSGSGGSGAPPAGTCSACPKVISGAE